MEELSLDLYISDLDGTLLNSQQIVSENSARIINNLIARGLNFTIATARSYEASRNILKPLHLKLPVILNNGAFIYDPVSRKNIVENYVDNDTANFILKHYASKNIFPFISVINDEGKRKIFYKGIFNKGHEVYIKSRKDNNDKRLTKIDTIPSLNKYKIINIFAIEKDSDLKSSYELFKNKLDISCHYTEEIYSKGYFWLETTNSKANKSHAAQFLKKYIGADKLICFGDNLNDEPLFKLADEKYAVKNAYKELKALATSIIGSNDEDGVAKFILYKITPK